MSNILSNKRQIQLNFPLHENNLYEAWKHMILAQMKHLIKSWILTPMLPSQVMDSCSLPGWSALQGPSLYGRQGTRIWEDQMLYKDALFVS